MSGKTFCRNTRYALLGRRRALQALAAGASALLVPTGLREAFAAVSPDVAIRLVAAPDRVSIWPGTATRVLRFKAEVLQGRPDALRPMTSYLGPTLELRRGERVRIQFINRMNEPSIERRLIPDDIGPFHGIRVATELLNGPRFLQPDLCEARPRHVVTCHDRMARRALLKHRRATCWIARGTRVLAKDGDADRERRHEQNGEGAIRSHLHLR